MSRPEGPGAIKFIDATKQDDVAIRRRLLRGAPGDTPLEDRLTDLRTKRAALKVQLVNLRAQREGWLLRVANSDSPPMARADAKQELRSVEKKINSAETELRDIARQIEETRKQIAKASRSRRRKAVFPWQEIAAQLIMLHKFRHTAGDCVLSTQGATITTHELQRQLDKEGFRVEKDQLRRFMRRCGVAGQQGRRTDLRPTQASDAEWTKTLRESATSASDNNRELREQRRAEQSTLTEAEREQRRKAFAKHLATPKGRKEQRAKQAKAANFRH